MTLYSHALSIVTARVIQPAPVTLQVVFDSLPISKASRKALSSAVSDTPSGSLFIFVGSGDLAFQAAAEFANAVTPPQERSSEISIARLPGDRWLREDVSSFIQGPSHRASSARPFVVVESAHLMDQPLFDSLLKTIEEPLNGCTFILAVPQAHLLPQTYISRASWILNIGPLDVKEAVSRMTKNGISQDVATRAVSFCGDLLDLSEQACKDPSLLAACEVLVSKTETDKPVTLASSITEQIEHLASMYLKKRGLPAAHLKQASRQMCDRVLTSMESDLSSLLRKPIPDDQVASLSLRLQRIEQSRVMLWRYARLDLVLTNALL